ncbi:MAG: amino acid ABC transporter permease [Hyphomicrobiaceae bacterium]
MRQRRRGKTDPRSLAVQAIVLALVVAVLGWLLHNLVANLSARNITSGFGFLWDTSGFAISQKLIAFDETSSYGRAFLVALLNTLLVAAIAIPLATVVGVVVGVARLSSNPLVSWLGGAYVELVRNVPLLLQLFFWYFAVLRPLPPPRQSLALAPGVFLNNRGLYLPEPLAGEWTAALAAVLALVALASLACRHVAPLIRLPEGWSAAAIGRALRVAAVILVLAVLVSLRLELPAAGGLNLVGGLRILPELVALVLALAIYTAAFIAEIVRGAILSVRRGQLQAARALGLRNWPALRLVVLPQAVRSIIPPLTNQYLNLTKNSSLAAAIAYPDVVSVLSGPVLEQTNQAIEVVVLAMGVYLVLSLTTAGLMSLYGRRHGR